MERGWGILAEEKLYDSFNIGKAVNLNTQLHLIPKNEFTKK